MNGNVPTYALYGEHEQALVLESLHCESIPSRSRLYDWEIKLHRHELFMQILYIRRGSIDIQFDERQFHAAGPCLLYVPALDPHGFRFSEDIDGAVLTVVTQQAEALLAGAPELLACFATAQHLPLSADARFASPLAGALERLLEEFDAPGRWRLMVLETLLRLVLILLGREMGAKTAEAGAGRSSRSVVHVQRFKALLNASFREQREIAFYASLLGITPTQLNRVCREELQQSALGVINNRLVMEAKRDLAYSSLSVKEIALTLGFSDPAYFSRFFTKQTRHSPTDFRALTRASLTQERRA